jgi:hypothetical protein
MAKRVAEKQVSHCVGCGTQIAAKTSSCADCKPRLRGCSRCGASFFGDEKKHGEADLCPGCDPAPVNHG